MRFLTRFFTSLWQELSRLASSEPALLRGLTIRGVTRGGVRAKWGRGQECRLVFHFPRACANDCDGAVQRTPAR